MSEQTEMTREEGQKASAAIIASMEAVRARLPGGGLLTRLKTEETRLRSEIETLEARRKEVKQQARLAANEARFAAERFDLNETSLYLQTQSAHEHIMDSTGRQLERLYGQLEIVCAIQGKPMF